MAVWLAAAAVLVAAPAAVAAPGSALQVGTAIEERPTAQDGEVFDQFGFTADVSDAPQVVLGSSAGSADESPADFRADDVVDVVVTHPDGSTVRLAHDFSDGCSGSVNSATIDLSPLLVPGRNVIGVALSDRCGDVESSSDAWVVGNAVFSHEPVTGRYAALGDSYASGEGTPPFDGLVRCHQSTRAAARLFATDPGLTPGSQAPLPLDFRACTGSKIADLDGQFAALRADTRVVTLSIGGNDVGFSGILSRCFLATAVTCEDWVGAAFDQNLEWLDTADPQTLLTPLQAVYQQILRRAPNAHLYVVGYPQLFPDGGTLHNYCGYQPGDENYLNDQLVRGNDIIARAAGSMGARVTFVPIADAFRGHSACSGDEWINGPSALHLTSYSFHPDLDGQKAIAEQIREAYHG